MNTQEKQRLYQISWKQYKQEDRGAKSFKILKEES